MKLPALKTYWFAWACVVLALFIFKFLAVRLGIAGTQHWLGLLYVAFALIPLMIASMLEQLPLSDRIENNRRSALGASSKWACQLRVLFHGESFGDPEIARLRQRQLRFLGFAVVAVLLCPPIVTLLGK